MPNLRRPILSAQIGSFMDTPERAALIKGWATHLNCTHGAMMRDALQYGLYGLIARLEGDHGRLPADVYDAALLAENKRASARAKAGAEVKRAERALPKKRARKKVDPFAVRT